MKIGILTYHHVVNIGSVFQCLTLYEVLTILFPEARVEVIDYTPAVSDAFVGKHFAGSRRGRALLRSYRSFLRAHCRFSERVEDNVRPELVTNAVDRLGYDLVVVGSDTVFQLNGYFGAQIAAGRPPNAYFMPGQSSFKKVGFSVSFDPYAGSQEEDDALAAMAPYLQDFAAIFYRDATACELLNRAGCSPDRLAWTPDPTIMRGTHHLLGKSGSPKQRTATGVSIANQEFSTEVKRVLKMRGCEVVDIMQPSGARANWCGLFNESVPKRMQNYLNLSALVTDRFHGSILALQSGLTNIVGIEDASKYRLGNGKLRDLYQRLGIEDRFLCVGESGIQFDQLVEILDMEPPSHFEMQSRLSHLASQGFLSLANLRHLL